jgi:hypothetical protein
MEQDGWARSSRCDSGTCVLVMRNSRSVWVRDSTTPRRGAVPVLSFTHADWSSFLDDLRHGKIR